MAEKTPAADSPRDQQPQRGRQSGQDAPPQEHPPVQEQEQEQERPLNETVPGGRYIVGDQTVDAEGRPLS